MKQAWWFEIIPAVLMTILSTIAWQQWGINPLYAYGVLVYSLAARMFYIYRQGTKDIPTYLSSMVSFLFVSSVMLYVLGVLHHHENPNSNFPQEWFRHNKIWIIALYFLFIGSIQGRVKRPKNINGYFPSWLTFNDNIWRKAQRSTGWITVTFGALVFVIYLINSQFAHSSLYYLLMVFIAVTWLNYFRFLKNDPSRSSKSHFSDWLFISSLLLVLIIPKLEVNESFMYAAIGLLLLSMIFGRYIQGKEKEFRI